LNPTANGSHHATIAPVVTAHSDTAGISLSGAIMPAEKLARATPADSTQGGPRGSRSASSADLRPLVENPSSDNGKNGLGLDPLQSNTPAAAQASPTATVSQQASAPGILNVNSIPVSNAILDGRPLGSTPKMGLSVAAGAHTVVFVHPEHGRKMVTITVEAGQTAIAATRFP